MRLDATAALDPHTVDAADAAVPESLETALDLLASPDTGRGLHRHPSKSILVAADEEFPVVDDVPILLPRRAREYLDRCEPWAAGPPDDAFEQYLFLHRVRLNSGVQNLMSADEAYQQNAYRTRCLLADWGGRVLDIGCDNPRISRAYFPPGVRHLGIDPSIGDGSFRVVGMAEFLPTRSEVFEGVTMLGSLDHVLDYHAALGEAARVLQPGGRFLLSSLTWSDRAGLEADSFHFHHFRLGQLLAALERFKVVDVIHLPWKQDTHRVQSFFLARKSRAA